MRPVKGKIDSKNTFQHKLGVCVDSLEEVPLVILTHTGLLPVEPRTYTHLALELS